jgi:hypothetical protein
MSDFERYQTMMLDHLYGLLEPERVVELEVFLATTPEGETLRQQAEQWKRDLALAAKSEFPDLQFTPPTAKQAARPQPVRSAPANRQAGRNAPQRSEQQGSWAPWAIAASILAVGIGFGIPLVRNAIAQIDAANEAVALRTSYENADGQYAAHVKKYNTELETADRTERQATVQNDELGGEFQQALEQARKAIQDKQFVVRLSGPERAQPGAPNEWRVEMYKKKGGVSLPGKIEWQVKDQAGQVVFADSKMPETKDGFREEPTVKLPVSFWEKVKPDSDLTLEVVAYENNLKSKVNARIPLARPVFVTHLATDKPLYKPGETVFFRSLTLDRATFTPPEKDMLIEFRITKPGGQPETIVGPDGQPLRGSARGFLDLANPAKELLGPDRKPLHGIGCGSYDIGADAAGGEYALSVVDVTPGIDEVKKQVVAKNVVLETRKFNVIKYRQENTLKTLEFDGKSYGAGDVVMVKCTGTPVQGGKRKLPVRVAVEVDGRPLSISYPPQTDADGVLRLKFTLPKTITFHSWMAATPSRSHGRFRSLAGSSTSSSSPKAAI